ncbi:uncharacterized protein [Palaemon carinicauda]|uniref:uncharacterized protein n=1 Tax=Palaemon carinicauda TaxID=392227 RepID=UPI0035B6A0A2
MTAAEISAFVDLAERQGYEGEALRRKLKLILLNGVDVDSFLSEDGHTALNLASKLSEEDCFKVSQLLLTQGANPNIKNKLGESSVHLAASRGFCKVLDLLLVNGGDPMLGDLKGQSPIDLAYKNGQKDALNLLNKVLDEENYEVVGYHNNNVVFSLLKEEAVEILCNPDDEAFPEIKGTHSSDLASQKCSEMSNLSKLKMTCSNETLQESCSDFSLLSMSRLLNSFCLETDLSNSNLSGLQKDTKSQYLDLLKGELANNTESDSDTDMLALQTYLRKNLLTSNDLGKSENTNEYSDTVFESTYNDFNTAQSPLENVPTNEFDFELSYALQKEKSDKQQPLSNAYDNYQLKRDLDEIYARSSNGVHHNDHKHQKSTYQNFDQSSLFLYESQSELLSESQYSLPSFLADVDTTAPLNTTKPEGCNSFQLLKAPKKVKKENTYKKITNVDDSDIIFQESRQCIKEGFEPDTGGTGTDKIEDGEMSSWDIRSPSFNLHKAALKASCNESSCSDYGNSYIYEHREKVKYLFAKHMDKERNLEMIHSNTIGSYGSGRSSVSMGSTVKSFVGLMKEFLYEDLDEGISFIERRCLTSEHSDSFRTTSSTLSSDINVTAKQIQQNMYTEVKPETGKADYSSTLGTLTDSVKNLRGEPLVKSLKEIGFTPGPVLPNTERLYQRHLMRLRKNPDLLTQACDQGMIFKSQAGYGFFGSLNATMLQCRLIALHPYCFSDYCVAPPNPAVGLAGLVEVLWFLATVGRRTIRSAVVYFAMSVVRTPVGINIAGGMQHAQPPETQSTT